MRSLLVVGLLGLGCGGGGGDGGDKKKPPAVDTSPCSVQVNKGMDAIIAKKTQGSAALPPARAERMEKLRGALQARCSEDKWSEEMLTCVATITSQPELMRCQRGLPPEHQKKLQDDIVRAMTGGGGPMQPHMPDRGSFDAEATFEKKLVELQEKLDVLVRELSEVKSQTERTAVSDKIEAHRAEKDAVETQLRELRNRKAAGADGSAGSGSAGSAGSAK